MQIKTNMPRDFAEDLSFLFEKHDVVRARANGWDDGCLYLTVKDEEKEFWVEFVEEDE